MGRHRVRMLQLTWQGGAAVFGRSSDPRLDPRLRPHEWEAGFRRVRVRRLGAALSLMALVVFGLAYSLTPVDRTADLSAVEVAETAGWAILNAGSYRFTVELTGEAQVDPFPAASMKGVFQRSPQLLHLVGQVLSGESYVDLEYYVEDRDLYLKDPRTQGWLLAQDAPMDELQTFRPDNLAAPLISGVLAAREIGRDRLPGGAAVILSLELDPAVMLPRANGVPEERITYRLWVYTRTLQPARFAVDVDPVSDKEGERQVVHYAYRLDWDFGRMEPVTIPDAVRQEAVNIGSLGPIRIRRAE